jgi:biopolymer transport protein ExbD
MRKIATPLMSEINITPLTDVMLVLLIIFMIASPLLMVQEEEGEEMEVPKTDTAINLGEAEHLLFIQADGTLMLDDTPVSTEQLDANLREWVIALYEAEAREGLTLFIAAEEAVTWKKLADIMSLAKKAGVEKLGMVEELIGDVGLDTVPVEQPSG